MGEGGVASKPKPKPQHDRAKQGDNSYENNCEDKCENLGGKVCANSVKQIIVVGETLMKQLS